MPTSPIPSLPVDEMLVKLADSVAQAQQVLDQASLRAAVDIRQAGLDTQFGLSATWYAIPELTFDLKLAFEIGDKGAVTTQMVDAEYQNKYGFNVSGSSLLSTKIVTAPSTEGQGMHLMEELDVRQRIGALKRVVEAYARAGAPHIVAVYRAFAPQGYSGGLWYALVLDALEAGGQRLCALVVLNDQDGSVVRLWTDDEAQVGGGSPGEVPGGPAADAAAPVMVEGVAFTAAQAAVALRIVNAASEGELKEILGSRAKAVPVILAQRPFASLEAVAGVPQVGTVSIQNLHRRVE